MFNVRPTKEWPWLRTRASLVFRLECLRRPLNLPKSARRRPRIFSPSFCTRSCSHGGKTADTRRDCKIVR